MRKAGFLPAIAVAALGLGLPLAVAQNPGPIGLPIRLKAATFDPLRGEPALRAALRHPGLQADERGIYLVQFTGPFEASWKAAVAAAGGDLLEYVPDFAFKTRMSPAQALAVRLLARVRWVGPFHPGYKLSPRLIRAGERPYLSGSSRGSDATLAETSMRAGGRARPVARRGRTLVLLATTESRLDALARLPDVAWVENFVLRKKHNEQGRRRDHGSRHCERSRLRRLDSQTIAIADTGSAAAPPRPPTPTSPPPASPPSVNRPGVPDVCFQTDRERRRASTSTPGTARTRRSRRSARATPPAWDGAPPPRRGSSSSHRELCRRVVPLRVLSACPTATT